MAEEAGVGGERVGRCVVLFDYDNDADLDIYEGGNNSPTYLFRNNGDVTFTDVAREAGVFLDRCERLTTADYDNDGYIDIFVMLWQGQRILFHNNGNGTFTDVAKEAGIGLQHGSAGGCAFADYDGDGDLDLYEANFRAPDALYRNNGSDNNWLHIKTVGVVSNRDGIGARVMVQAGELAMMREINCGYCRSRNEMAAHFGLGKNTRADSVEIRWPSGQVDVLGEIPANRFITVREGAGIVEMRIVVRVTSISPPEGRVTGGEPIAIFGAGFPAGAIVTIGGKPLTDLTVTDTLITGVTPPGTEGEQDIRIEASDYGYSIIGKFIYNPPTSIVVSGITPDNGKQAGGNIGRITGSGFLPGATVTIGGSPASDVGITPTLIILTIPPGVEGPKDVVVTNPDGGRVTLRGGYTYNPLPVIEKLEPRHGGPLAGGTEITITGDHFMEGVAVTIGEKRVQQLDFFSPTELRLKTPPAKLAHKQCV